MALRRREELWCGWERKTGEERSDRRKERRQNLSHSLSLSPFFLTHHLTTRILRHARDQALHLLLLGALRGAAVQVGVKKKKERREKARGKKPFFFFLLLPVPFQVSAKERDKNCVAAFVF